MLITFFAVGCSSIEKAESLYRQGDKQEALEMAISLLDDDFCTGGFLRMTILFPLLWKYVAIN